MRYFRELIHSNSRLLKRAAGDVVWLFMCLNAISLFPSVRQV